MTDLTGLKADEREALESIRDLKATVYILKHIVAGLSVLLLFFIVLLTIEKVDHDNTFKALQDAWRINETRCGVEVTR